jgi:uncharacterized membrane protein YhaH (DUF805 family)
MGYMFLPLRRYFDFSGRSRRREYWLFFLFVIVGEIVTMMLDSALGLGGTTTSSSEFGPAGASASFSATGGLLTWLFLLLMIVPGIAVAVRRVHDQDKSGWFVLIPIYNIILMFLEGTRGPNRFGPDPKGGTDEQVFG